MRVDRCAICENIVQSFQTIHSTQIPLPPRLIPNFPGRNSSTASAEEFYNRFYYSEGLKHKLKRVPLLGLPKYIYILTMYGLSSPAGAEVFILRNCFLQKRRRYLSSRLE